MVGDDKNAVRRQQLFEVLALVATTTTTASSAFTADGDTRCNSRAGSKWKVASIRLCALRHSGV